jgi:hypothetical protein
MLTMALTAINKSFRWLKSYPKFSTHISELSAAFTKPKISPFKNKLFGFLIISPLMLFGLAHPLFSETSSVTPIPFIRMPETQASRQLFDGAIASPSNNISSDKETGLFSGNQPANRSLSQSMEVVNSLKSIDREEQSSVINGPTLPIRLSIPPRENVAPLKEFEDTRSPELWFTIQNGPLLTNGMPSTITVSFQGTGSGEETCSGDWGYQKIIYNQDIDFQVVGVNPSLVGDYVSYDLSSKIGTIHFYGTAEDHFYGETTILNFDRTQQINLQNTEGTLDYFNSQCNEISIGFSIPSSATLPYSIYLQYSSTLDIIRNTVNMPYPWNAGTGCLSNNYDVPATSDLKCEFPENWKSISFDIIPKDPPLNKCPPENFLGIPDFSQCKEQSDINGDGINDCLMNEIKDCAGNKFQLWCQVKEVKQYDRDVYWYSFVYTPCGKEPKAVGKCQYLWGKNEGKVIYKGNDSGAKRFLRSIWRNVDDTEPDEDLDPREDGFIHWDDYFFDPNSDLYETTFQRYKSIDGPGGNQKDIPVGDPEVIDPWPDFDSLPPIVDSTSLIDGSMTSINREPCDLNNDKRCDDNDSIAFQNALDACSGDDNYNANADFDMDGCVTEYDRELINPCKGDFNNDGDIDGNDLASYSSDSRGTSIESFAFEFGKSNCLWSK